VRPADVPPTCYDGKDPTKMVPCGFGLVPQVNFTAPKNGKGYYEPGETFQITLAAKDGLGNYLHPPDRFPSFNDFLSNKSNGIMYLYFFHYFILYELDTLTAFSVAGPRQLMRPYYELNGASYWQMPSEQFIPGIGNFSSMVSIVPAFVAGNALNAGRNSNPPTTFNITLPPDAKPGTYQVLWKVNRGFMGERFTKMLPFPFQVGQKEETFFPGRVGNCQLCHRGVISLDNVRHGLNVDYIEGCKACHTRDFFVAGRNPMQALIHRIHMSSMKFPRPKNQCVVCHLTRESALRPSYVVCNSCHPEPHGNAFEQLKFNSDQQPDDQGNTVYGNCARMCHENTPPTQHILPVN
jgi:hypothetical protein